MEKVQLTSDDFVLQYVPGPGFLLIQKDNIGEKHGSLFVPRSALQKQAKWSSTGKIVARSPFRCNEDYDDYLMSVYRVGDRVGFSSTVPHMAPAPPYYEFVNEDNSVVIHCADIIGIVCDTPDKYHQFLQRVESVSHRFYSSSKN